MTSLSPRDARLVQLVGRFGQLSSGQIARVLFPTNAPMVLYRALTRLTGLGYLARIERRIVGGAKGGSGMYVYQLGRAGWRLAGREGRPRLKSAVDYHALAIADCYVRLVEAERGGALHVLGFTTEPETWVKVGGAQLAPDLYVDVRRGSRRLRLWLEVDMGTQRQTAIKDKLRRYYEAWQGADVDEWPHFPLVVFLTPDEARSNELRWLIEHAPAESQALFDVAEQAGLVGLAVGKMTVP